MNEPPPVPDKKPVRPPKPLHRDLSFWIVVLTLAGAADLAQLDYGLPWINTRWLAAQPAPRMTETGKVTLRAPTAPPTGKQTLETNAPVGILVVKRATPPTP